MRVTAKFNTGHYVIDGIGHRQPEALDCPSSLLAASLTPARYLLISVCRLYLRFHQHIYHHASAQSQFAS
ncbi:unnamed protein product [Dicrocoelium dendriticum]|nr:unnamed protein product [Dicrocoelium dendriticum]